MTLIETLVAFSVFLVCAGIIIFFLPIYPAVSDPLRQDIHMFFQQMKDDMDYAYEVKGSTNVLTVNTEHYSAQYRKSGGNIVRSKDGAGYEIVLQNIQSFQTLEKQYGVKVQVTDRQGVRWQAILGFRPSMERGKEGLWIRGEL